MIRIVYLFVFIFLGCNNNPTLPKPKAFLYKEFTKPNYKIYKNECGYSLDVNMTSIVNSNGCNLNLYNEEFKSTIFISFLKINNNLDLIKSDFNIKINENSKNAFVVNTSEYSDPKKRVFAKYFSFTGNTPANTHFFITDSVSYFLTGSLYFESKPNYDSLIPYINYTNNDIRKMIQSFQWN